MRKIVFIFLLMLVINCHAGVNKCNINGKIVYTEIACPDNTQQTLDLKDETNASSKKTSENHTVEFSALAPDGITINNVSENSDGYKVTGVSKDNNTIKVFMDSINNSQAGTPDLKMVVLNPNGAGKYFEVFVLKEGRVIPPKYSDNKKRLLDKKYNVRVIIKKDYFEIDGNRYSNQTEVRNAYMNKKDMKIVVCIEKDAPGKHVEQLLNTLSQLSVNFMDVLPEGNECS